MAEEKGVANVGDSNGSLPMVCVEWYDAKFHPGPHTYQEIAECRMSKFRSVGYLISKDETTTKIAMEYSNDGEYRDLTLIPTGAVIQIEQLSLASASRM